MFGRGARREAVRGKGNVKCKGKQGKEGGRVKWCKGRSGAQRAGKGAKAEVQSKCHEGKRNKLWELNRTAAELRCVAPSVPFRPFALPPLT